MIRMTTCSDPTLYPRGNYFNELATLGPRNFFNVHPFLTLKPHERFSMTADWDFFWRQSLNDGLYSPAGALIRGAGGSRAHYVGSAVSLTADWQINRHLDSRRSTCMRSLGNFIRDTGPAESIDFIETTLALTLLRMTARDPAPYREPSGELIEGTTVLNV